MRIKRYEYGIFNADKEKICAANDVSPDDPDWAWLWNAAIDTRITRRDAECIVDRMNQDRAEAGLLETYGPVKYRRRLVEYDEWEDVE